MMIINPDCTRLAQNNPPEYKEIHYRDCKECMIHESCIYGPKYLLDAFGHKLSHTDEDINETESIEKDVNSEKDYHIEYNLNDNKVETYIVSNDGLMEAEEYYPDIATDSILENIKNNHLISNIKNMNTLDFILSITAEVVMITKLLQESGQFTSEQIDEMRKSVLKDPEYKEIKSFLMRSRV